MSDAKEIRKFYLKRLISILPLYYVYAIVNIIYNIADNGMYAVVEECLLMPIETLGLQSIFSTLFPFSHNGGSWFISCILICYFAFPLILILTKELTDKTKTIIVIVLGALLLWSPFVHHYFHTTSIYANPFFRLFEFSIGVLVCQMNIKQNTQNRIVRLFRTPYLCAITICILITGVSIARKIGVPSDFMLYNWIALPCFISLLISLGYIRFEIVQRSKIIQYLSALSFSIFLSQLVFVWKYVQSFVEIMSCDSNIFKIIISATICFVLANLLHFFIEKPSSRYLKTKLLK